LLELSEVSVAYGPVRAVQSVSLRLQRGELGAIIGANGAGKSSLLKAISGIVPLAHGHVRVDDEDLARVPPHLRRSRGVVHVLEGHRVFGDQTVEANLQLGAMRRRQAVDVRDPVRADLERQYARFPILVHKRKQLAGSLSGGQQQMLAIACALMAHPHYLLLDEPSLGLSPKLVDEVFDLIAGLRSEGLGILLIEQRAARALEVSDVGWVMQRGAIVLSGPSKVLLGRDEVRSAYLGGAVAAEEADTL